MNNKPIMLIILDGFGQSNNKEGNAVYKANMPTWKYFLKNYPNTLLKASGESVGLLPGFIGNSEVGHLTMGSGRIVKTILAKFHESIENKSFFKNKILSEKFIALKNNDKNLHIMGLLSDAGVHSHEKHLHAILKIANNFGLKKVYIHCFLDGRDTPPKSAKIYLERLEQVCKNLNCGTIASLHGRFYAMDRDNNWKRTKISYDVLTGENKSITAQTWNKALENSYKNNTYDEFFESTQLTPEGKIKTGDGIIFFNFRPDRARQLTEAFINPSFNKFSVKKLNLSFFISTSRYKDEFAKLNNDILFENEKIEHTLLDEINEQSNKKVFIIAETEKYAHVTYFFRGMQDKQLPNETRKLIPSIKAKNYINHPEMSAKKITDEIVESLTKNPADFYLINFANPDMVGHSGDLEATVKACEFIDKQLKTIYDIVIKSKETFNAMDGTMIVTADHGNAEEMLDPVTKKIKTSHTLNPVPFVVINKNYAKNKLKLNDNLGLANITPTILKLMKLQIPIQIEKNTII